MAVLMSWRNKPAVQDYQCSQQLMGQDSRGKRKLNTTFWAISSRGICQCQSSVYMFKIASKEIES